MGQQAQLLPTSSCSTCAAPCSAGAGLAPLASSPLPIASLDSDLRSPDIAQPLAVTVALESTALNRYAALVFGLPLVALFALAWLAGSLSISTPSQVPIVLLIVAALLLSVTALCRSVARRFESQLRLEIRR